MSGNRKIDEGKAEWEEGPRGREGKSGEEKVMSMDDEKMSEHGATEDD